LLSGACGRLGGGDQGAARMNSATVRAQSTRARARLWFSNLTFTRSRVLKPSTRLASSWSSFISTSFRARVRLEPSNQPFPCTPVCPRSAAQVVVSLPRCLPEPVRGAFLLAAMHDARSAARQGYASSSSASAPASASEGAVVLGCVDDAAAALLASLADGTLPAAGANGGDSAVLVVDVGAALVQATVFAALRQPPPPRAAQGWGPLPRVLGASAGRGVGFAAVVDAVAADAAARFAKVRALGPRWSQFSPNPTHARAHTHTHANTPPKKSALFCLHKYSFS
jgi:hypothetical protein